MGGYVREGGEGAWRGCMRGHECGGGEREGAIRCAQTMSKKIDLL